MEIYERPPRLSSVTTDTIIEDNRSFIVTFENPDKILPLIFGEDRSVEAIGHQIVVILTSTGLHDVLSLLKLIIVFTYLLVHPSYTM